MRVAGVAMRLPGPWGGFWGTWKAGRAAGTHRHCRDERATARGAGGQQCSINAPACTWLDTGAGPAGQTGLWERGLHPPGARRQEFLSLHVSPGAASQARGRWPGSESAAAVTRGRGPTCSPTHTPPTAPASANRRCLGWRGMILMFPLTPEGETYGPLRNTCSRSDPGSSPGISAIFKTRVGAPWPQTKCPHCGLTGRPPRGLELPPVSVGSPALQLLLPTIGNRTTPRSLVANSVLPSLTRNSRARALLSPALPLLRGAGPPPAKTFPNPRLKPQVLVSPLLSSIISCHVYNICHTLLGTKLAGCLIPPPPT